MTFSIKLKGIKRSIPVQKLPATSGSVGSAQIAEAVFKGEMIF